MKLINKAKQATSEVKQKVKDAALATDTFISCPKCHVPDDLALSSEGLEMLTRMTYTQLIDAHPTAFMHDGRLYPHGRKSASGSSVQTSKR